MNSAEFQGILLPSRDRAARSWLEILRRIEIGDKARLRQLPSQELSRSLARRRAIHQREMREPAKVLRCLLRRFADYWDVHTTADRLSDLSKSHALLGHSVISGSRNTFLQHESVKACCVEAVHRRPAVRAVVGEYRDPFLANDSDRIGDEPLFLRVVDWPAPVSPWYKNSIRSVMWWSCLPSMQGNGRDLRSEQERFGIVAVVSSS
jgi:hypothetical protein